MKYTYIMAVDPARAYAIVRDRTIIECKTVPGMAELAEKIDLIARYCRDAQVGLLVRIERPTNLKTFPRPGVSIAVNMAISRKCGMNYQKATDLGDYCGKLGIRWEFVAPARRKLSAKEFQKMTGYKKRLSQHARDSVILALR